MEKSKKKRLCFLQVFYVHLRRFAFLSTFFFSFFLFFFLDSSCSFSTVPLVLFPIPRLVIFFVFFLSSPPFFFYSLRGSITRGVSVPASQRRLCYQLHLFFFERDDVHLSFKNPLPSPPAGIPHQPHHLPKKNKTKQKKKYKKRSGQSFFYHEKMNR